MRRIIGILFLISFSFGCATVDSSFAGMNIGFLSGVPDTERMNYFNDKGFEIGFITGATVDTIRILSLLKKKFIKPKRCYLLDYRGYESTEEELDKSIIFYENSSIFDFLNREDSDLPTLDLIQERKDLSLFS